jgi:hypothetical protein
MFRSYGHFQVEIYTSNVNKFDSLSNTFKISDEDNRYRIRVSHSYEVLFVTFFHTVFILDLFFNLRRWKQHVPPNRRFTFKGIQGVRS